MTTPDRRPIAARELPIFQRIAAALADRGASANAISIAGMLAGLLAGTAFFVTLQAPAWARLSYLAAALFIQVRLLANMLDGMVAIRRGLASPVGELYNEVPDRISDAATLIGLGFAAGSSPLLGLGAAGAAIFVAYIRAMGKAAGGPSDFRGPMAKQQRMFLATLVALFCACAPPSWWSATQWILALIILGSLVTALRRLRHIARSLR